MTSRYVFCPMTSKHLEMRMTIWDRIRRRFARRERPDLYMIVDYWPAIYPSKK